MDGDPAVESGLDSFSLTFPLPYRVAFIIVLAVWGWGIVLQYLSLVRIDVPALIHYPRRNSPHQLSHHHSTYRLATVLTCIYGFALLVFWVFTRRDPQLVMAYDWLPMTYLLVLLMLFVAPLKRLSNSGRARFLHMFKRVSIGGLAEAKFGDIVLCDVLTSLAKVIADLYVALCMFFKTNGSATARPDRGCGGTVIVPLIIAWPSLCRFRQCLIEFDRVRRAPRKESDGWGGDKLANAVKYFSAFPVVISSALLRNWQSSVGVYRGWVLACAINSGYSWYWDVTQDWDLTLLRPARERNSPDHPWGLRGRLQVGPPLLYYFVIALDLCLRFTWALKLSPHMDHIIDFESSIFIIEFLEVFRRWVWIFFRVEAEWIRNSSPGPMMNDILLGDYYKDEEDED